MRGSQLILLRKWLFFCLTGGPNWPSWGSEDFRSSRGAQTDLLEEMTIFVVQILHPYSSAGDMDRKGFAKQQKIQKAFV